MKIDKFNEWMKEFPELDELWNKLPLITRTLFEIQIQNYATEQVNKNIALSDVSGSVRCLNCYDKGILYDKEGNRAGTCPCHY